MNKGIAISLLESRRRTVFLVKHADEHTQSPVPLESTPPLRSIGTRRGTMDRRYLYVRFLNGVGWIFQYPKGLWEIIPTVLRSRSMCVPRFECCHVSFYTPSHSDRRRQMRNIWSIRRRNLPFTVETAIFYEVLFIPWLRQVLFLKFEAPSPRRWFPQRTRCSAFKTKGAVTQSMPIMLQAHIPINYVARRHRSHSSSGLFVGI